MATLDAVTGYPPPAMMAAQLRGAATARPVLPAGPATPAPAWEDTPGSTARRALAAAVRSAALRAPGLELPSDDGLPGLPVTLRLGSVLARITAPAALPLLPEPATPARAAFAEAVIALRTGIRRDGAELRPRNG